MPIAFVLVDAEVDRVKTVLEEIQNIDAVTEAYSVAGEKDIVARAEAERFQDVAEAVTKEVHKVDGIKDTVTFFAFE